MPFVRVSYLENKYDAEQLPNISRDIMSALVEHFNVPEDDFFQVFHAHKASEFYYSPNYLNIERTDGLLFIQITLKSGRSTEQKRVFTASWLNCCRTPSTSGKKTSSSCWSIRNLRTGRLVVASHK